MKRVAVTYSRPDKLPPYVLAVRQAGLEPVPMAPPASPVLDGVDGLLITGGADVDPALYKQSPHPETVSEPDRDRLEAALLRQALERDLPVLCICRGMQLLNVLAGGTLEQHLPPERKHTVRSADPSEPVHQVVVNPDTTLARILGQGRHPVNSRHHQAVKDLGEGLVAAARADDGLIEAIEAPGRRFAVGVQWHPEDQVGAHPAQRRLFEEFARAVMATGGARGSARSE